LILSCAACLPARGIDAQPVTGKSEEVVVTGQLIEVPRRQLGTAVSIITSDEIELRGYHSLADVLRTQPAIGVSNAGGVGKTTTLRIRGEESYRTMLLIDGVKALDTSAPQVAPGFDGLLTTSELQRIEVLRGPQGFIYGADAGGVVNVLSRTGAGPVGGRLDMQGGEYGMRRYDASVSGGSETADYFVSASDLETDGFNARLSDAVVSDEDSAQNTTLHAKAGWNASEDLRLQFVVRDVDATAMFDGCGFPAVHDCIAVSEQVTYRLSADHVTDRFTNRFGYSEVEIERENLIEGASRFSSFGAIGRFEYTGSFRPTGAATLVYGIDLQHEDMRLGEAANDRGQDGYYVEYQGEFRERFFLSAGARYDDNEDFGTATSVRISAAYLQNIDSAHAIRYRASYGTGFRAPSMFEVEYNAGPFAFPPAAGFALGAETSKGYDLGIEYTTSTGLHLEVTWFDQQIEDAIVFDLIGFSGYLQDPGQSTSKGFEVVARVPVGNRIEVLANWTNNEATDIAGDPRARRPETLANLGVSYAGLSEDFRFIANYRVTRDAVDQVFGAGFVPLENYEVLDLSASYRVNDALEVFARIENAFDEAYSEIPDFNSARRSAYAGVRLRF
jgi:vitamin B12 transporter